MQDAGQDGTLTIAEAAAQLGVSADTVRRRIRRGELPAVQVPTPNGPAWRVTLGATHSAASTLRNGVPGAMPTVEGAPSARAMQVEAPLLAQLLADTQAELVRTAAAAAMWQTRAEILTAQLEQAQRQLPAPRNAENPHPDTPVAASGLSADHHAIQKEREPWWAFWRT